MTPPHKSDVPYSRIGVPSSSRELLMVWSYWVYVLGGNETLRGDVEWDCAEDALGVCPGLGCDCFLKRPSEKRDLSSLDNFFKKGSP